VKFIRSIVGLMAFVAVSPTGLASAEGHRGPCSGESSAQFGLAAHHVGGRARNAPKIIVHASSDERGDVVGKLVFERGGERLSMVDWCRMWGEGESSERDEGVVHLLGVRSSMDGSNWFIRVDVKQSEGGRIRVMKRSADSGGHVSANESSHGWQSMTGEGWLDANRVQIGAIVGK
jgi:hypothetical protein